MKINDKHFEVIVRQMMRKVIIEDPGDTRFLEKQIAEQDLTLQKRMIGYLERRLLKTQVNLKA